MKTSSKIAIAVAAVGAWLIAKKKGIAGVGKIDYSDYDNARIISTKGSQAIEFDTTNNGKNIIVTATYFNRMYPKDGLQWEYLHHIGTYKTFSGAVRAAKKYWDERGVAYNEEDFKNL